MLEVYERLGTHYHGCAEDTIELDHEQRDRGRLKLNTAQGQEIRIFLARGKPLRVGEFLKSTCGQYIQVQGALEPVALAACEDWQTFARACYHLGNRHTKIQLGPRWLRIKPDHVLEHMLEHLGLSLHHHNAVFEPESGAYHFAHSHQH